MREDAPELWIRTHGCGELGEDAAASGLEVVLTGWVHRRRDLGQLVFIDLRDATGRVQVVFDPSTDAAAHALSAGLRQECVIGVRGSVVRREAPNPEHPTGAIEIRAVQLAVHARVEELPLTVDDDTTANEETRLTYRWIDLRRPRMQRLLRLRHRLASRARAILDAQGFVEVETPMLTRSTPEGARDYLVPSRVQPGKFYALPQSPQLFKQLLMIAGFDRYYQFARCFRDEDLRADRQPEFTQIDIEMAFATPQRIYDLVERIVAALCAEAGIEVRTPFPRMSYDEALARYGTDRPDTRYGLELCEVAGPARGTGFAPFDGALDAGGTVCGIAVPRGAAASRAQLDRWQEAARGSGARGLVWIKLGGAGEVSSPAAKALGEERARALAEACAAGPGDVALLVADAKPVVRAALGALRQRIAAELELVPSERWDLLWVEGFPLFGWDAETGGLTAMHHPFTAPLWEEADRLDHDPASVRAQAYDLVLNGTEIAGGSIRIHRRDVQQRVFAALGIDAAEAEARFGFLLRALGTGAPPHGGIAFGFDRVVAMLGRVDSIRDVIAFPKTTRAACLMTEAPSTVEAGQLLELGLSPPGVSEA